MAPAPKPIDESTYSGRFAARLRMLREKAGLTVEELAEQVGLSYAVTKKTIYNWESGIREPPFDALPALAETFGFKSPRMLFPEK